MRAWRLRRLLAGDISRPSPGTRGSSPASVNKFHSVAELLVTTGMPSRFSSGAIPASQEKLVQLMKTLSASFAIDAAIHEDLGSRPDAELDARMVAVTALADRAGVLRAVTAGAWSPRATWSGRGPWSSAAITAAWMPQARSSS